MKVNKKNDDAQFIHSFIHPFLFSLFSVPFVVLFFFLLFCFFAETIKYECGTHRLCLVNSVRY